MDETRGCLKSLTFKHPLYRHSPHNTIRGEIIIKNIFNNVNEDTLRKAKNKLDMILTERQKKEIINKLQGTDRYTLINMLNNIDLSSVNNENIEKLISNMDAESIIDKLKRL